MIRDFKEITAENPVKEVWKLLRFFRDVQFASEQHRRLLNISEEQYKKHKKYIEKQAKQIGYCIRQAEEYFQASSQVGLATRPNLLYYGAVSLSQALILLKQNGEYSLDARRNTQKHNHHGLELKSLVKNFKADDGTEAFFNSLQCNCFTKSDKEQKIAWGHFPLFYQSLVPCAFSIDENIFFVENNVKKNSSLRRIVAKSCEDKLSLDIITANNFNSLELLKTLPDMYFYLQQIEINPDLCSGGLNLITTIYSEIKAQKSQENYKLKLSNIFLLNNISSEQKNHLIKFYQERNPSINLVEDLGSNIVMELEKEFLAEDKAGLYYPLEQYPSDYPIGYYPNIVEDISRSKFYILKPETYLPELAAYLILLFCLGMLCRYYPDIWMKVIDENVQIAELTDSLLNIIYRKFPNLILDQMTETKHYVHS